MYLNLFLPHINHKYKSINNYEHAWKKPISLPVVCVAAPIFGAFLHSFVHRRLNFCAFLLSFDCRRLKNWISVGDRTTGLFPCMIMKCIYILYLY